MTLGVLDDILFYKKCITAEGLHDVNGIERAKYSVFGIRGICILVSCQDQTTYKGWNDSNEMHGIDDNHTVLARNAAAGSIAEARRYLVRRTPSQNGGPVRTRGD